MNKVKRKTSVITLEQYYSLEIADFSSIRIEHPVRGKTGRPIDIGAIVYSNREWNYEISSAHIEEPTAVDISSHQAERQFFLKSLPSSLVGKRSETVNSYLKSFIKVFDWVDRNGFIHFVNDNEVAFNAYVAYSRELESRVKNNKSKPTFTERTAKDKQWFFRKVIEICYPDSHRDIINTVPTLTGKATAKGPVEESALRYYWNVNLEIFNKFTDQCFDNSLYPPLIKTEDIESYYFASSRTRSAMDSPYCHKKRSPLLDYKNGKFIRCCESKVLNHNQVKALMRFSRIKETPRDYARLQMAMRALNAFVELFRILTSCNRSTLRELKYNSEVNGERDFTDNEFLALKYRAKNKEVRLRLHVNGYKLYKKYLKLREWILNGVECDWLFFSQGKCNYNNPEQLRKQHSDQHHGSLKRNGFISTTVKPIQDAHLRTANNLFLKNLGYHATEVANRNNHSLFVADSSYSLPSESTQKEELANYHSAIMEATKLLKPDVVSTTDGICNSGDYKPKNNSLNPPIQANCSLPMGCLFCKYYATIADDDNIRKLLSMKFIALEIKSQAIEFEYADEVYDPIILRIDSILKQLKEGASETNVLINKIQAEVFDMCKLTPFWSDRLDYYDKMGVITL